MYNLQFYKVILKYVYAEFIQSAYVYVIKGLLYLVSWHSIQIWKNENKNTRIIDDFWKFQLNNQYFFVLYDLNSSNK